MTRARPSGLSQPWNFVLIRDAAALRGRIHDAFASANAEAADRFPDRKALYSSLKLEGILQAPVNLCITCDRTRGERRPRVLRPRTA